LHKTLNNLIT